MAEIVLSFYYFIGATAGIVSIFLALRNWRKDRPIIKPIIHGCWHEETQPTIVTVDIEVKNVGNRETSLGELKLRALDDSSVLHGELNLLEDARNVAAIKRPYRPDNPPDYYLALPIVIRAGSIERLIASFQLDGVLTHEEARCILTVRYTHGEKTVECRSRRRPPRIVSILA